MMRLIVAMQVRAGMMAERSVAALRREDGQGMAEYGIVIALVAVVAAVAIRAFGAGLVDFFNNKVLPLLS